MEKSWLKYYPPGMGTEIDISINSSLVDLLEESFQKYAQRRAFICMGKAITYQELDQFSRHLAAWLQSKNLQRGARIAIMLPNVLQYPIAMAAILRAGFVVVNINPLYTARELEHQLKDSGAEAIVILENFAAILEKIMPSTLIKHVVVASTGDLLGISGYALNFFLRYIKKAVPAWHFENYVRFNDALAQGAHQIFTAVKISPDDVAFLQYTGGTTGLAKGATLLHRNIFANVLQLKTWFSPIFEKKTKGFTSLTKTAKTAFLVSQSNIEIDQHIVIVALPLYHIFALTTCGWLTLCMGGLGVLIPEPRNTLALIKTLKTHQFNIFPAVNTLYNALLDNPAFAKLDFSKLIIASGGGMAIQASVAQRWLEVTGVPIIEGYGLSETSPCVTCNPLNATKHSGTIGLPLPSTDLSIRDEAGDEVSKGEAGEICIRGPQVMAGYWNQPDETAKVMTADGFFRSGDIGIMDEYGFVKLIDRKKDMILVSGFNVYPNEIEEVVTQHPGVFEAAAVGVPDKHSGQAVKLFVVRKDPTLAKADITAFCQDQLTGYKRPKVIEFCAALPKTNIGKISRIALRKK